jgi:CRISPR-associated protein Csd1
MLLQKLCEFADRQLDLPPGMYQRQPIRYVVELDANGRFLGVVDTQDSSSATTRRGTPLLAPHVKRTVGVKPKLLADSGVYAFGIPVPTTDADEEKKRAARAPQQREAFASLVAACAEATGEPTVEAVATFLDVADPQTLSLPADFDSGATMTFRVDGVLPIDLPAVRAFWAGLQEPEDGAAGERMECVVCGQTRPAMQRHPLKVKGIRVGQTGGTDLISANAKAFESYGLEHSLIAPTCQVCAEKYGNALNALLAGTDSHVHVAGVEYVFWTATRSEFKPGRLFSDPSPVEVQQLIEAARSGRAAATALDATAFYALALGASGSRVAVLDWIDTTVGEAKRRLGRYFALQDIVEGDGDPGTPMPIWRLAGATVRDPRKETPPASVPSALLRLALGGEPLPMDLLFQAVRRNRAEQGVSRERAALIKMVLGSRDEFHEGGTDAMTELDTANQEPAYLCGRLLAVLDAIQRQALNNPNATIVDRFYGAASSAPASVFGTLLHGAQAHMGKLRKDPRTQGAHAALERRLEEVMEPLETFPPTLTLQEQGLFALGFYHQRAADRRARRERAEEREVAAEPENEKDSQG